MVRYQPVLTAEGDLMIAGGIVTHNLNFETSAMALLLHVSTDGTAAAGWGRLWPWMLAVAVLLLAGIAAALLFRYRQRQQAKADDADLVSEKDEALMQRLCMLMEERKLYLNKDLRVEEVAVLLDSNRTYVSNCIKNIRGCQFMQFVNTYRVEHAKQVLMQNRDTKMSYVWSSSGFSSEPTFFRIFKEITGMTPREWLQNNASDTIE